MRHLKAGKKLNRTSSHRKALMRNMAQSLFEHKRIHTTEAKAKALRPYAEKLITRAKTALHREQNNLLPEGQSIDVHSRRVVAKELNKKDIIQELFDSIAPVVAEREGGYIRIIKTGVRRGDSARTAMIELVDWSSTQESQKPKKTKKVAPAVAPSTDDVSSDAKEVVEKTTDDSASITEDVKDAVEETVEKAEEIAAPIVEEVKDIVEDIKETSEETIEEVKEVAETVVEEVKDVAEDIVEATDEKIQNTSDEKSTEDDDDNDKKDKE